MNEVALDYCKSTLELKDTLESGFLQLGKRLMKIRDEQLYLSQYETWDLFVDEMKMSSSMASRLISIYQRFVVEYGIEEQKLLQAGGWSQLAECLGFAQTKEQAEEVVELAGSLSRKDLRATLAEKKTGIIQSECQHDMYKLEICRKCNFKCKILE